MYIAWVLLTATVLFPALGATMIAWGGVSQFGWWHSLFGVIVAGGLWAAWVWCVVKVVRWIGGPADHPPGTRHGRVPRVGWDLPLFVMVLALGPMLVRVVLPWEEPDTGEGSPMATLLGVVFLGLLGGPWVLTVGILLVIDGLRAERLKRDQSAS